MIEDFDTAAARIALARRMLGCPGCDQPLRPWGHARERTVRDLDGVLLTGVPGPGAVHRLRHHPRGARRGVCCRAAPTRPG